MFKIEEIQALIQLIDQSSINEFTYKNDDIKISLKKSNGNIEVPVVNTVVQQPVPTQVVNPATINQQVVQEGQSQITESSNSDSYFDYEITSPMVGTFYRAPSPEEEPYVKVGSQVTSDTIVCIVEAMKLFNEIEAEVTGEIVEVLPQDGELVEYGQPLFRVKTR